jgi:hypothetical protein
MAGREEGVGPGAVDGVGNPLTLTLSPCQGERGPEGAELGLVLRGQHPPDAVLKHSIGPLQRGTYGVYSMSRKFKRYGEAVFLVPSPPGRGRGLG